MRQGSCKHFCGFRSDTCDAGVNYLRLAGGDNYGMALRLPCNSYFAKRAKEEGIERIHCEKREEPTTEEIAASDAALKEAMDNMMRCIPWISATKKRYPKGGSGTDVCPICEKAIHFSVSSYNRHMRAQCTTEDCVNFIE